VEEQRTSRVRLGAALAVAVLVAGVAALAAGCGGGDDEAASTASEAATTAAETPATTAEAAAEETAAGETAAAPTGEPIKLMTIADVTSQGPIFPNIAITAEAYETFVNANGGIAGRPVDVIACDAKGTPTDATACARQAVSEGVVAVVGSSTFTGDAIMSVLEPAGIAYFGMCCPLSPSEWNSPDSFPLGNMPLFATGLVKRASEDGCEATAAVLIEGGEGFKPFIEGPAATLGLTITKYVTLPATSQDFSPQVAEATDGTDCILMLVPETPFIAWMPAFAQSGSEARMYAPQGNLNEKVATGFEDVTDGDVITGMYPDISLPQWDDYRAALELADAPTDQDYNSLGGLGTWTAYEAFQQVAETIDGELTAESFLAALPTATVDLPGKIPPVDFSDDWSDGIPGFPRLFNQSVVYSTLEDGKVVPLTTEHEDVGELAAGGGAQS
jgi:ABC-type branched-subunit amino acid transport system substrate-binding protein